MAGVPGRGVPKTHDLQRLLDLLGEKGIATGAMETLVDLNAFAVQYRYETLYDNEEPVDRLALTKRIESLIQQVAIAIQR